VKFDQEPRDHEKELMQLWQENLLPDQMDAARIVREIAGRVERFDRTIWWRNLREYAAGAILIVYFSWMSFNPAARLIALAGIVAVGFVMIYLLWSHRQTPPLDPSTDGKSYQAALLDRYDRQIRLLRGVKYWYVLPLYLWMLLSIVMTVPTQETGRRIRAVLLVTAFSIFVVWLNEGYAVRKLRDKRRNAEALLEEGKQ
jgi:hypothetical protein